MHTVVKLTSCPWGSDAQLAPPGESRYSCSSSASYMSIFVMTYKASKQGSVRRSCWFVIEVCRWIYACRITRLRLASV